MWEKTKSRNPRGGRPRGTHISIIRRRVYLAAGLGFKPGDRVDVLINRDAGSFAITPGNTFRVLRHGRSGGSIPKGAFPPDFVPLEDGDKVEGMLCDLGEGRKGWVFKVSEITHRDAPSQEGEA